MSNPFFSIIVVSYNASLSIEKTIKSVLNQNFDDYEIIVKDGLSTDHTIEKIPKSNKIKVVSEKDCGIYDAMNRAIELSSGKYICFLNCGDCFCNEDVLGIIYRTAQNYKEAVIYGDYSRKNVIFKQPGNITKFYLYRTPLCHQTMFIAKDLFDKNGYYDTSYKILADFEHTLHDYFSGIKFVHCSVNVCNYLGGGASETKKGVAVKALERKMIIEKYYSKNEIAKYDFFLKLTFKKFRQRIISDKSPQIVRLFYRKIVNLINK